MGSYVTDPNGGDVLDWLIKVGSPCNVKKSHFADLELGGLILKEAASKGEVIIACVENPEFKAALILDGPLCAKRTSYEEDNRPVSYWSVALWVLESTGLQIGRILAEGR